MTDRYIVPDGLKEIEQEIPLVVKLIARTARWVHPDTFRELPVWYPEVARGQPSYNANWTKRFTNKVRRTGQVEQKSEANILAGKALVAALGVNKPGNWTVCHIWGYDDPSFVRSGSIVRDPRFYSCVGNMIWLPTPLKGFTDAVPGIKTMLRTCAFHIYGWACEHPDVAEQALEVRDGKIPPGYPDEWPKAEIQKLPPGTAPFSDRVATAIQRRKEQLRRSLADSSLINFPRDQVREVLEFWKIKL